MMNTTAALTVIVTLDLFCSASFAACNGYNAGTPACPAPIQHGGHQYHQGVVPPEPTDSYTVPNGNVTQPNANNVAPNPNYRGSGPGQGGGYGGGYNTGTPMGNRCAVGGGYWCGVPPAPVTTGCYCSDPNSGMQYPGQVF